MSLQTGEEIKCKNENTNKGDLSQSKQNSDDQGQAENNLTFKNKQEQRRDSSSPNEEIIGVCNGIYAALISNTQLLEKFIYQKNQTSPNTQRKKRNSVLADYLSKIQEISPFLNSLFHKNAIDQLAKQLKELMQKVWESLSLFQHVQYQHIANTLRKKAFKNKQMSRFNNSETGGREMFVLDVMAHFMLRNREYQQYCTKTTMRSIISKKTMEIFFGQTTLYSECWDRYIDFEEWLYFDFQQEFHELITITSIVELKNRIVNNSYRYSKQKNKASSIIKIGKMKFEQRLLSNKEEQQDLKVFKYKFCQLVFSSFGSNFCSKAAAVRSQIQIKLANLLNIPSQEQQSKEFLSIKYDYSVNLGSLKNELNRIKEIKSSKTESDYGIDEKCLGQLEWRHLPSQRLPLKFSQINFKRFSLYTNYEKLTMKKICQIALNKIQLFEKVTNLYLTLQKSVGRKPIYIFRYDYSYNQLIRSKNQSKQREELQKDIQISVIIVFGEKDCILICSARSQLNFQAYSKFLKKLFALQNFKYCLLVLYEFNAKKRIPWQTYLDLYDYLQKNHETHVYVSTNKDLFRNHFDFASYIQQCLRVYEVSEQNFYCVFDRIISEITKVLKKAKMQTAKRQEYFNKLR